MSIFDLLLVLIVLLTAGGMLTALGALLFRRRSLAARILAGIAVTWLVYLGIGTAVAVSTPQRIMRLGEDRCFDEMCFAVTGWNRTPSTTAGKLFYIVHVAVSNRSRSHAQREIGRKGVLVDQTGRLYEVSREGMLAVNHAKGPANPGLDAEVAPGKTLDTTLVFEVPGNVENPGFALGSNLRLYPPRIVIGDEDHFLHWPTVVPLG
jgi:hypothetical protein